MVVLLPEGRAINNPDTIKMVKVMPNNIQGKQVFVVSIKLDDDSELMIKSCSSQEEAEAMADQVKERIYGEPGPWRPLYDGYTLEITSVRPEPDRSCMRPFIRDFDD